MSKVKYGYPEKLIAYKKMIAHFSEIELKGISMPYTSLNGNMFSFLDKNGSLILRLNNEDRELFIKKFKTDIYEAHGAIMKEYVAVPETLYNKTNELKKYFELSLEYVKTLKTKPTKK